MRTVIILAVLAATLTLASTGNIVCYFPEWTIYRAGDGSFGAANVDPTLCTHIIYAYVGLNESGYVQVLDTWDVDGLNEVNNLVALKEQNPDLKLLFSIGGYSQNSSTYSTVAADPDLRATFAQSVLDFLELYQFDGLDVDWEYPALRDGDPENDPANFILLLSDLHDALGAGGYLLSVAVSSQLYGIDISYPDVTAVSDNVDLINLKSYDYHGDWDVVVGHNAPLYPSHLDATADEQTYNVAASILEWLDKGADQLKINVGLSTYGRSFTLTDPEDTELYAPVDGAGDPGPITDQLGVLGYNEICIQDTDEWVETWDDEQKVPHRVNGNQWVGYDDVESIKQKVALVNSLGLGGVMVWSLDTDDFLGTCGDPFPLLTTINENLN